MIYLKFPVPAAKARPLRNTFCCKTVGCDPNGRRYRYFQATCEGVTTTRHCGIDIAAPAGSPVVAVKDGTAYHVNFGPALGLHQFLIVDSAGRRWYYAHTRSRPAHGAKVKAGQVVAQVGNESFYRGSDGKLHPYNIGAHVHFMVFTSADYRHSSRNPFTYLEYARTHAA